MDCIFCKIVKGEIESAKIYEDDEVLVFLDINPVSKGHALVIPKNHFENIFDIDQKILEKIIVVAKRVSLNLKDKLEAHGIRIAQSNGSVAGQEVMHFHLHIIPRYKNDGLSSNLIISSNPTQVDFEELKKLALRLNLK